MREKTIAAIENEKIIAIIRGIYGNDCLKLVSALLQGGIRLAEITFDQASPEKWKDTMTTIQMIRDNFGEKIIVGAGTVTTPELVDLAWKAGAQYIISPNTSLAVIHRTKELGLVSIPGALTPTEAQKAYEAGADFVKLFPVSQLGPSYLKAVAAPLNHIRFLAVGGVNQHNVASFFQNGARGVGVGGNLCSRRWVEEGCFAEITELALEYTEALR